MPELGEVAHATATLRRYLAGKVVRKVVANDDPIILVKPLTHTILQERLTGLRVLDAYRQGKYFWLRFAESPLVLLMHFGMTGWIKVRGVETHFIVMENGGDKKAKERADKPVVKEEREVNEHGDYIVTDQEWPPRFTKFTLATDDFEVAFTDPRRLGRVRLLEAANIAQLMSLEPLSKLGPDLSDPETRPDLATFSEAISRRQVPIKSLLMDQALVSGIGNWVADEILYHSRLHPEQVSSTLEHEHLATLYKQAVDICSFVVQVEGNVEKFPDDWLMLHRWGKGRKKEQATTKQGHVVSHVQVGGRTSAFVPALQIKFGAKRARDEDEGQVKKVAKSVKKTVVKKEAEKTVVRKEAEKTEVKTKVRKTRAIKEETGGEKAVVKTEAVAVRKTRSQK